MEDIQFSKNMLPEKGKGIMISKQVKLAEKKLEETTAGEKFGQVEPEDPRGRTISEILDECEAMAEVFYDSLEDIAATGRELPSARQTNTFNVILKGPTGAGKTSLIATWAKNRGYELVTLNMLGDALDFLGLKAINREYELQVDDKGTTKKVSRAMTVPTQAFDCFLRGKMKILFLDEINKANQRIVRSLFDLISFHLVQSGDNEMLYLPKLLFTVGAMNPSEYGGDRETLDPALKARMKVIPVNYDTMGFKEYLIKTNETSMDSAKDRVEKWSADPEKNKELIEKGKRRYFIFSGRLELAKALFANPAKFKWTDAESISTSSDDDDAKVLVPRTLEAAFQGCDGTKKSFLLQVKEWCGLEALDLINNILANYKDKEHIANKIWGQDYTPVEKKPVNQAEEDIVNSATDDEKAAGELSQNLYRKLQSRRTK